MMEATIIDEYRKQIKFWRDRAQAAEAEASRAREEAGEFRAENKRLRNWVTKLEDMLPEFRSSQGKGIIVYSPTECD